MCSFQHNKEHVLRTTTITKCTWFRSRVPLRRCRSIAFVPLQKRKNFIARGNIELWSAPKLREHKELLRAKYLHSNSPEQYMIEEGTPK